MKNIYNFIVVYLIKIIIFILSDIIKRGTSLPGKIANKLSKNLLTYVSKGYVVIFVTGTNGKTTTTSLISSILSSNKNRVVTNTSGANMFNGILTTFIKGFTVKKEKGYAVIEIDEANLKKVTPFITPSQVVITNIFRDQLDRYGEVYNTLKIILDGVNDKNTKLLLNGDEPLFNSIELENEKVFFGLNAKIEETIHDNTEGCFCIKCNSPYKFHSISFNHLGNYYCEQCGYKRPNLKYQVSEIVARTPSSSTVILDNEEVSLSIGGIYNVYNALCAYTVCMELGLEKSFILEELSKQGTAFGRQETININGKNVTMLLVKNPVGFNEAINSVIVNKNNSSLAFLLNDNYADSRDVSWIWDVHFEKLDYSQYNNFYFTGTRKYDIAIRNKIAGMDCSNSIFCNTFDELLSEIQNDEQKDIYLFTSYTAMIQFRELLYKRKFIDKVY